MYILQLRCEINFKTLRRHLKRHHWKTECIVGALFFCFVSARSSSLPKSPNCTLVHSSDMKTAAPSHTPPPARLDHAIKFTQFIFETFPLGWLSAKRSEECAELADHSIPLDCCRVALLPAMDVIFCGMGLKVRNVINYALGKLNTQTYGCLS